MGKGEIARNEQFLLFSQCFLPNQIIISKFVHIFDIVSLYGAQFEKPKLCISGKGLSESMYCCVEYCFSLGFESLLKSVNAEK